MKTIATVARTYPGPITIIQTMSGLLAFTKDNNMDADLEEKLSKIYDLYRQGKITKQEMQTKIDQLMSTSATQAHK